MPTNTGLEVTTRLVDVLEDEVDEKYYLSEEKTKKLTLNADLGGKLNMYDYNERDRVHNIEKVSPTLNTMQGGDRQPKIAVKGFKEVVKVRKYDVNKLALSELLRISKQDAGINNKEISDILNVPITKVEHWFRSDKSFSIPDAKIWFELKTLLNITNTEHDEVVTTFEEKESEFDTTNRVYDVRHLSPTLNTTSEPKIAIKQIGNIVDNKETFGGNPQRGRVYNTKGLSPALNCMRGGGLEPKIAIPTLTPDRVNKRQNGRRFKENGDPMFTLTSQDRHGIITNDIRIRKLTPLECWRLQGFTDEQFYKAKDSGVSNSQLYKQAGNSVTVNVVDAIVKCL